MSTSLALGAVGAVVGSFFGVAGIGFAVGYALGGYIDPTKVYGPKLTDLKLQGSQYGAFEPIPFGKVRLAGNVIWQTDLEGSEHSSGGKGGGPEQVTTTYSASFDIEFCGIAGTQLVQLFADSRLIYDSATDLGNDLQIVWYDGSDDQLPDPTEQAAIETSEDLAGLTPAYRGIGRLVATDMDMSPFFNRIPLFEAVLSGGVPGGEKIRLVKATDASFGQHKSINDWDTDLGDDTPLDGPEISGSPPIIYLESDTYQCHYRQMNDFKYDAVDPDTGAKTTITVHLWADPFLEVLSNTSQNVAVSRKKPMVSSDGGYIQGQNFAYPAGVESGACVKAACITRDSKTLFLFTGTSQSDPSCNKWWKIRGTNGDIKVVDHGTCSPTVDGTFLGFGNFVVNPIVPPLSPIGAPNEGVAFAESNGKYIWSYYGIADPGPSPPGSCLRLWKIDSTKNFVLVDFIGGSSDFQPMPYTTVFPSIFSMAQGYAGTIGTHIGPPDGISPPTFSQMALWTRLLPGEDSSITVGDAVGQVCELCGMTAAEYDVSELTDTLRGAIISSMMPGRSFIESLMPVYFFDSTEEDGKIVFVKRGSRAPLTIPDDDLAMHEDGAETPPLLIEGPRKQDVDLPARVTLQYFNVDADYQIGSQPAERIGAHSELAVTINVAVVLSDSEAKQRAEAWIQTTWIERTPYQFQSGRKYSARGPCDVFRAQGIEIRATKKTVSGEVIKWEGVEQFVFANEQIGIGGVAVAQPPASPPLPQDTDLLMLDIPYPMDQASQQKYLAAMHGHDRRSWVGAALFKSIDDGATYTKIATDPGPGDTFGVTDGVLGDWDGGNVFDRTNQIKVVLGIGSGTLESVTRTAAFNGANTWLIGDEIVTGLSAVLVDTSTYVLYDLLRYRFGTETIARGSHVDGERFVALPVQTVLDAMWAEYGVQRKYVAVTFGGTVPGGGGPDPGPGPVGPPGSGTVDRVFPWAAGNSVYDSHVSTDGTVVIQFTTGSTTSLGNDLLGFTVTEITGSPPRPREIVLSRTPGSFVVSILGNSRVVGALVSMPFEVGADHYGNLYPVLALNTTYYINHRFTTPPSPSEGGDSRFQLHIPVSATP